MYCIYTLTKVGYDKYHVALLRFLRFFFMLLVIILLCEDYKMTSLYFTHLP